MEDGREEKEFKVCVLKLWCDIYDLEGILSLDIKLYVCYLSRGMGFKSESGKGRTWLLRMVDHAIEQGYKCFPFCPDGHVIGGAVAMLIAATPVQVVLCSFVYGGSKTKNKQVAGPNSDENSEPQHNEKLALPSNTPPTQNYNPSSGAGIWPGSRQVDLRNPHTGIDLTRG
ncbi:AT-hook motif nuclear-localized protein 5 [Prunus yedoensis var. nudiflora]|uniref:AT-hook motif nuclear-localized protein n=1 Tax=Prunus yedoensis var. nudiflora TaxID=2094558 RepID=A0A314UBV1_PRUYE|nr:AT-hook motif nuclear-localized protein 5 [Prunus yedoensis var. nudiflora]